ncbi:MAG: ELM1/GtrOC1 family putative glycosyltransferase [Candidatus Omnitrophota bacterium]
MTLKDYAIDCFGYFCLKLLGPLFRLLPPEECLKAGALLGDVFYVFDPGHRSKVYDHIKTALGGRLSPEEIRKECRGFYRSYGQNLLELFLIPLIDEAYLREYITIEGLENVRKAFAAGKGVLLTGVHEGSWELSNIISAALGFPFNLFVREQRYPLLGNLLNHYRRQKGCRVIERGQELRRLLEVLRNNEAVGISVDQGGRGGVRVDFFGREASMSSGVVKIAMKYGAAVIPVFYERLDGPYTRIRVLEPFEIIKTGDEERDLRENLQRLTRVFEECISSAPREYLWMYKVWKYGRQRSILLLSDGKAGHLRQSQGLAQLVSEAMRKKGYLPLVREAEVKITAGQRFFLTMAALFRGKDFACGRLWGLPGMKKSPLYNQLGREKYDVIISGGSSLGALNILLGRENRGVSMAVMRPSWVHLRDFGLSVIPVHDRPAKAKNVIVTSCALSPVGPEYLAKAAEGLTPFIREPFYKINLGFLVGGDTKGFKLDPCLVSAGIGGLKKAAECFNAGVMVSSSRRTPAAVEELLRRDVSGYERKALLIIANEFNPPDTVGGMLALCRVMIITPESISMVSEAVASGRHILVIDSPSLPVKHRRFLKELASRERIILAAPDKIEDALCAFDLSVPAAGPEDERQMILKRLDKLL